MKKTPLIAALTTVVLLASSIGEAAPIVYQFLDHPDGAITGISGPGWESDPNPYGLRADAITPIEGVGPTFSVVEDGALVLMSFDTDPLVDYMGLGIGAASISGAIASNLTPPNDDSLALYIVNMTLTGRHDTVDGPWWDGGFGTLTAPGGAHWTFDAKADSSGMAFLLFSDAHRCSGHPGCGPIIGRGWLQNFAGYQGGATERQSTNDWLVMAREVEQTTGDIVPEPTTVLLVTGGLGMLALRRRTARRR